MPRLYSLTALLFTATLAAAEARDPWVWPFASDSIWNTPIGSGADYQGEGHFQPAREIANDTEFFYKVSAGAPKRKLYQPEGWPVVDGRHGKFFREFQIDDDVVLKTQRSNNCAAFLLPDGKTIEQLEPFIRFKAGGDVLGIPQPFHGGTSIAGPGIVGTHFGSGLSAIGGSLRHGELTGAVPIRHALKVDVLCKKYLHYDAADATPGYRWPAKNADGYAGRSEKEGGYKGSDPRFEQGALLAVHPRHTAESLGLKTQAGRILHAALRDYGAYIVDDAGGDGFFLCAQHEAEGEFAEVYGHGMTASAESTGAARAWFDDVSKLQTVLAVVDNNRADNIGGGGTPHAALAPPIGQLDATPPSTPGDFKVTDSQATQVTLAWSPATDDVRVLGYYVYVGDERVAETFGKTSATLTGLQPDTELLLFVRARDTGHLLSEPSFPISAHTSTLPPGTVLEDFDDDAAQGWKLEGGAAVRGGALEITNWKGEARAHCALPLPSGAFTFSAALKSQGGAPANVARIFFRRSADGKSGGVIEIGGGQAPVKLRRLEDGRATDVASAADWDADRFTLTCNAAGAVTLRVFRRGTEKTLFDRVSMPLPSGGHIGFAASFNNVTVDGIRVLPVAP